MDLKLVLLSALMMVVAVNAAPAPEEFADPPPLLEMYARRLCDDPACEAEQDKGEADVEKQNLKALEDWIAGLPPKDKASWREDHAWEAEQYDELSKKHG